MRDGFPQIGRSRHTAGQRPTRRAGSTRRGRGGRWPGALGPGGPGISVALWQGRWPLPGCARRAQAEAFPALRSGSSCDRHFSQHPVKGMRTSAPISAICCRRVITTGGFVMTARGPGNRRPRDPRQAAAGFDQAPQQGNRLKPVMRPGPGLRGSRARAVPNRSRMFRALLPGPVPTPDSARHRGRGRGGGCDDGVGGDDSVNAKLTRAANPLSPNDPGSCPTAGGAAFAQPRSPRPRPPPAGKPPQRATAPSEHSAQSHPMTFRRLPWDPCGPHQQRPAPAMGGAGAGRGLWAPGWPGISVALWQGRWPLPGCASRAQAEEFPAFRSGSPCEGHYSAHC